MREVEEAEVGTGGMEDEEAEEDTAAVMSLLHMQPCIRLLLSQHSLLTPIFSHHMRTHNNLTLICHLNHTLLLHLSLILLMHLADLVVAVETAVSGVGDVDGAAEEGEGVAEAVEGEEADAEADTIEVA